MGSGGHLEALALALPVPLVDRVELPLGGVRAVLRLLDHLQVLDLAVLRVLQVPPQLRGEVGMRGGPMGGLATSLPSPLQ